MQLGAILSMTFREMWAKKIVVGLLAISTLIWVMLAFALNLDIVEGSLAGIRLFGQDAGTTDEIRNPETGDLVREALTLRTVVIFIETVVAGMAYWAGTVLGLFATAFLLPSLLESGRVDLLLSKPMGRMRLFAGHLLGVLLTMTALAIYLLGMVWLVMSFKTGIWNPKFFLAVVVVVGMFAVMYGVVALVGVTARSAPLALILAYGLIFASMFFVEHETLAAQIRLPWRKLYLALYHILPNFAEVTKTVSQLTGTDPVGPLYPLFSSLAFGAVFYAAAAFFFYRRDF